MDNNSRIIQWAEKYLLSHGYTINNNAPENIQTIFLYKSEQKRLAIIFDLV